MADNITVTPGTGVTIGADDVGGVLIQRVKLTVGPDGTATDVTLGQGNKAASLPVTIASDDDVQAKIGIVTETAPASDTASSGLNGRLQRVAQRLTSLIALLPTSLGAKTAAASLAVTTATDDVLVPQLGIVTETAPASDTASSGLNGRLQRVAQRLTSLIALLPTSIGAKASTGSLSVVLATDQATVPINQVTSAFDVAVSATRPADTTAYTANDVVGPTAAALTFATVGVSGATTMITGAQLEIDVSAIPSGMTNFRLYLYNVTPPSALADNAAWDLPSGDRASFLGYIDLGTPADLGSTLYCEVTNINKQMKLSSANVYGYLVTNGAYTPNSASVYTITLHTVSV
jgi:hypothetical protein